MCGYCDVGVSCFGYIMVISSSGDQTLPAESSWLDGFLSVVLRAVEDTGLVIFTDLASFWKIPICLSAST